jgi:hypothetical protein
MLSATRARPVLWRLTVVMTSVCLMSCRHPAEPTMVDPSAPVAGARTGPVTIEFISSTPAPGSTVAGCGPVIAGCAGKLRLSLRLRSTSAGPVLWTAATLHGANRQACLSAAGDGFTLAANSTTTLDLQFDQFDAGCALPFEVLNLAVVLEGPVQTASRQEFGVRYRFTP